MRIDNKREWKAEGGRVSHEEEGQGDAERRRQMKRPGRRRRARRGEEGGGRKTLSERKRGVRKIQTQRGTGSHQGRREESTSAGGGEGSRAADQAE